MIPSTLMNCQWVVYNTEIVLKHRIARVVFRRQPLHSLVLMFHNVLHIVGRVEIGQVVPQMVLKHELVIKFQIVRVGCRLPQLLNPASTHHLVPKILGNVATGELARPKAFKPGVVVKLMIARLRKRPRRRHRNIVYLLINPNNHRQIIQELLIKTR